jgi:hypothetical protein
MLFIEFIGYKWYLNNSNSSIKQKNTSGGKNVTKKGGHFREYLWYIQRTNKANLNCMLIKLYWGWKKEQCLKINHTDFVIVIKSIIAQ